MVSTKPQSVDAEGARSAPGHGGVSPPSFGSARASIEPDPELIALPAPPKRERTLAVALMALTIAASGFMAWMLLGEARYALARSQPMELTDLSSAGMPQDLANQYVRASGMLGSSGAIRYTRTAESDSFRLAPIAGNPQVWVEIRVPEGFEGPRYVPPSTFAGRLVPFASAGIRHVGLQRAVKDQTDTEVPQGAWLLIDGSSPRASRWAVALAALFVGFAAWNLIGILRVLGKAKESRPSAA